MNYESRSLKSGPPKPGLSAHLCPAAEEGGQACTFTINPVAHTIPLRLSVVAGENMKSFADGENHQWEEQ
jgi:hypothetical protein